MKASIHVPDLGFVNLQAIIPMGQGYGLYLPKGWVAGFSYRNHVLMSIDEHFVIRLHPIPDFAGHDEERKYVTEQIDSYLAARRRYQGRLVVPS